MTDLLSVLAVEAAALAICLWIREWQRPPDDDRCAVTP